MIELFLLLNIVACLLLFTGIKKQTNYLLGILLFLNVIQGFSTLQLIHKYTFEIRALFFLNFAPLTFLIGPILYFYVQKNLIPEYQFKVNHLIHFLPFLCFYLLITPYLWSPFSDKIQTIHEIDKNVQNVFKLKLLLGESLYLFIIRPIHILIYIALSLHLFARKKANLNAYLSQFQVRINVKWLQLLMYSLAIMHSCNLINTLFINYTASPTSINPSPLSYLAALTLANLSIQIFINPYILFGFNNVKYYSNDSIIAKWYKVKTNKESLFDDNWKSELILKIESEEINLRIISKGYSLAFMAKDLEIPQYHLNYYFKEISEESFPEFKNKKRIDLAIDLINNGYLTTSTVENLSLKCGFASRSNFNNAFLKATGSSLKDFKKSVK